MTTVGTSGSGTGSILAKSVSSIMSAEMNALDYFAVRFDAAYSDVYYGDGYATVANNSRLVVNTYSYNGNLDMRGTGFLGYAGTITNIRYSDAQGHLAMSGSLRWNQNGITGGTLKYIESFVGSDGFSMQGSMKFSANGSVSGTVTTYKVFSSDTTVEMQGSLSVSSETGTINKLSISDNAGSSVVITGSLSYATYLNAIQSTVTISDIFDVEAFFTGHDTFKVNSGARDWHGFGGNDVITGSDENSRLFGDNGNDKLYGLVGDDILDGGIGNDLLDGGIGDDTMTGGLGDDTYVVDSVGDAVVEYISEGYDTVYSNVTLTLSDNVEKLILSGNVSINATGNASNNALVGNNAANILDGRAGADTMSGGLGDDTYYVDSTGDVVVEAAKAGTDTVIAESSYTLSANIENLNYVGSANATLIGNASANVITSLGLDDTIDGGLGADTMTGGLGNDTYYVDSTGDVVIEYDGEGTDRVLSTLSYVLGAHIEDAGLLGNAAVNVTGNAKDNQLQGNIAANVLNGGLGADTLVGGKGNDTYIVDNSSDVVVENLNEGIDSIQSSVSYTLADHVENLTLTGTDHLNGTGNALVNKLTGNVGNNTLEGGAGIDTLIGGAGHDTYVVNLMVSKKAAVIEDYLTEKVNEGTDKVVLQPSSAVDALAVASTITLGANLEELDASQTGFAKLNLTGNTLANILTGNDADNVLDGGTGIDILIGGQGNDTYIVDTIADVMVEGIGQGIDTARIMYKNASKTDAQLIDMNDAAYDNIENVTVLGTGLFNVTGNDDNNTIIGNASANTLLGGLGNDTLDGGLGNDIMNGGDGDDTYVVDTLNDIILFDTDGVDTIRSSVSYSIAIRSDLENITLTGALALNATGNAGANTLIGNNGANILDGGLGADTMEGGLGNDTYIVDDVSDIAADIANGGIDLVKSSVSFALSANIENLTLTGTSDTDATGNALKNAIAGNSGANILDGGLGIDSLSGGSGDDTYIVDLIVSKNIAILEDVVAEKLNEGIDKVVLRTSPAIDALSVASTIILGANLEELDASQTGLAKLNLTGNALANILTGNDADNRLDGGLGTDHMVGGQGNDTYVFGSADDVAIEVNDEAGGIDTVQIAYANASRTLSTLIDMDDVAYDSIEDITITGTGLYDVSGSSHNNTLTGNASINVLSGLDGGDALYGMAGNDRLYGGSGDDYLDGGTGADFIDGGDGNDYYVVDNTGDIVAVDSQGNDVVCAWMSYSIALRNDIENVSLYGTGAFNATGNALDNALIGNVGANILNGGLGADEMFGNKGNDTYHVDNVGDLVVEYGNEGIDSVQSSITYTLTDHVENLTLNGSDNLNGTGNALANKIVGNTGNNILDGGAGIDTLSGGLGNDIYVVNIVANGATVKLEDAVTELANQGIDTLELHGEVLNVTPFKFVLNASIENVDGSDTGLTKIDFYGNAANNLIIGNDANNILSGGAGNDTLVTGLGKDTLYGGTGADTFVLNAEFGVSGPIHTIKDFKLAEGDKIDIAELLQGYFDPNTQDIHDFLQLGQHNGNSYLSIDWNGTGFGTNPGPVYVDTIAIIEKFDNSTLDDLLNSGTLIV